MTVQRDPDAILAAWLEDGPNRLPEATKRSIAVTTRTTRQSRRPMSVPWRAPTLNGMTRSILAAVAVVAVVVGGLYLLRPGPDPSGVVGGPGSPVPSVSPTPSASPAPSASPTPSPRPSPEPSVGALTQAFTSPTFGYSMQYPAGWTASPTAGEGPTPGGADEFDSAAGGWHLRALSRPVPDGVVVDDWIVRTLQTSNDAGCMPQRSTMESVTVDGHEGRLLGFCGAEPAPQMEASVVVGKRVYLFTLFERQSAPREQEARALFDRFMATVRLDPASAGGSPKPSPS